MQFNSLIFLLFLAGTITLASLTTGRVRNYVLLIVSLFFYYFTCYSLVFFGIFLLTAGSDFVVGLLMERHDSARIRKGLLLVSIVSNLGILVGFKYFPYLLALFGYQSWIDASSSQTFHVVGHIPPGLSFYTFQAMSYTIDVYRKEIPACKSPLEYFLFISFFPQLVAGPVVRAGELLPQIRAGVKPSVAGIVQGAELLALGYFKKAVVADNAALAVDAVFQNATQCTSLSLVLASLLFGMQMYCDFSGYSTMAQGMGKMLGFELPSNFHYPFLATDPLSYRRRWHMTMSTWFRDYVFHPLGGSHKSPARVAFNIMIVWVLFGIWHGVGFTFLAWGFYGGIVQAAYRELKRREWLPGEFPGKNFAGFLVNQSILLPSYVFFRSPSGAECLATLRQMFSFTAAGTSPINTWWFIYPVLVGIHVICYRFYDENLLNKLPWIARAIMLGGITLLIVVASPVTRPFVYFQF